MQERKKNFTRTVWILSIVSLFNDISSEMLYPVLPVYLRTIGFTALWIGLLEGFAEAIVGVSKGYFGQLSDAKGIRLPFIQLGYFLSSFSKSAVGFLTNPLLVLLARSSDKLGKGLRTGARDAMLSDESTPKNKGRIFGLHRAMDTAGAAIGPAFALAFLYFLPGNYKNLFEIAFLPAIIGVGLTFMIREKKKERKVTGPKKSFFSYFRYWNSASSEFRKLVTGLLIFALFNSSDIFLLLMAKHLGFSDLNVIGVYIFYNVIYAIFAYPLGSLADSWGMRNVMVFGFVLFAVVYGGMAVVESPLFLYILFFLYGIFAAATDGISRAWISRISPRTETATAIGFFASCNSIAIMLSSFFAGMVWDAFSPAMTLTISAGGALLAGWYLVMNTRNKEPVGPDPLG